MITKVQIQILCNLSDEAFLLDFPVDERRAYEADETAHGGSSQTQNGFH